MVATIDSEMMFQMYRTKWIFREGLFSRIILIILIILIIHMCDGHISCISYLCTYVSINCTPLYKPVHKLIYCRAPWRCTHTALPKMHSTGFEPARTECPVRLKRTPLDHSGTNADMPIMCLKQYTNINLKLICVVLLIFLYSQLLLGTL